MKPKHMPRVSGASGFTLIELMIVVAIVAILGTVAISGYINSVRKSRRTEARTALLDLASREERFMSTNSAYSNTPSDLGYSGCSAADSGQRLLPDLRSAVLTAATSAAPATFTLTAHGGDRERSGQGLAVQDFQCGLHGQPECDRFLGRRLYFHVLELRLTSAPFPVLS